MTENEILDLKLSAHLLRLMLDEKIPFEKKKGKMDYLIRVGADVNKKVYGKSMALWVKGLGNEKLIKYVKNKGGIEIEMSKVKKEELGKQFWNKNGEIKSVKEIKELVLMGADLGINEIKYGQIWKDLSLEDMSEILKDLPRGYVIEGDVDLSEKGLTELPDFSKVKVRGNFYCRENQLTDLKGAPEKVGEIFNCGRNRLTTLEGAPEKVGGNFWCYNNQLADLRGAPSEVGGIFNCGRNKLTTLEGAPEKVGGSFDCSENQLTTLEGVPEVVRGSFNCFGNKLTSLEGAPEKVGGYFYCSKNQLTDLRGAPSEVGEEFDCRKNQLTSLEGKPLKIGREFVVEKEVLARIEELEKQKKNNAVFGVVGNKFEM